MNRSKSKQSRKWWWAGITVLAAAILLFFGYFFFNNWLHNKLITMVREESKEVYSLQLYNLKASPLTGILSVDSLQVKPDKKKWQALNEQAVDVPRMLMHVKVKKVELIGLSYWNILMGKSVNVAQFIVDSPKVEITRVRQDTTTHHEAMHVSATGMLKGLTIDTIAITNGTIGYKHDQRWKKNLVTIKGANLHVNNFKLDSASFHNPKKAYYANRIVLKVGGATTYTTDGFYEISTGPATTDTGSGRADVTNIKLKPLLEAAEMSRKKGEAATYLKFELPALKLQGIQFAAHSRNNRIQVKKITLKQPTLSAFKDKKNFQNKSIKPLPHDLVQQVKTSFRVDTIRVQGMYVRYDELAEKATETGHLYFTNLNGTITNFTNMPAFISSEKPAVIKASAKFMGKASVKATIKMPLLDKSGFHTLTAEAGKAKPELLNKILEPTNLMSVKSGALQSGTASVNLNRNNATGTMRVLYQDFAIELLSESEGNKQSLGKKVISKAANKLAIKSSNPADGEKPRTGKITVSRDKNQSFFTYWKDCLASGFLSSVGLKALSEK